MVPFTEAQYKKPTAIDLIEFNEEHKIAVHCIAGYVFVELIYENSNGGLTQLMKDIPAGGNKKLVSPMTCNEYRNKMKS